MGKYAIAARLAAMTAIFLTAFVVFDFIYTVGFVGAWNANMFLSRAHIPLEYSAPDEELGFVRKPGLHYVDYRRGVPVIYQTDRNGFRNSEERQSADIVFIGDSFTEAAQVREQDTFVRLVERATGAFSVNLGRGAYGPQQELIVLRRYGLAYGPKAVVWQLFPGNDIGDAGEYAKWVQDREERPPLLRRYFNHSMLRTGLKAVVPAAGPDRPRITIHYSDGEKERTVLRYGFRAHDRQHTPEAFQELLQTIQEGTQLARSRGIRLIVTVVPTMLHALRDSIDFESEEDRAFHLPEIGEGEADFETRIREFCRETGCDYVDALGALRSAAEKDNRRLYIPEDEHLDARGHQAVADALAAFLDTTL